MVHWDSHAPTSWMWAKGWQSWLATIRGDRAVSIAAFQPAGGEFEFTHCWSNCPLGTRQVNPAVFKTIVYSIISVVGEVTNKMEENRDLYMKVKTTKLVRKKFTSWQEIIWHGFLKHFYSTRTSSNWFKQLCRFASTIAPLLIYAAKFWLAITASRTKVHTLGVCFFSFTFEIAPFQ